MMNLIEINQIGYKALADALGFDGMMQFLNQFNAGQGDYTKERDQWLDELSLEDIFVEIEKQQSDRPE